VTANEVDQGPDLDPATGQLSPVVLDSLAGQLDQRARARHAEQDRAKAHGGPCSRCGATQSWQQPGVGGWAGGDAHGAICTPCDRDRGGPSGHDEHAARVKAARLVLGETPAPAWTGHGDTPASIWWHDDYLAAAMRWWHETPGARPGPGPERFAYTSPADLLGRLYRDSTPRPPVLHSRGRRHRCPQCGARGEVWTVAQVAVAGQVAADGRTSAVARAHFKLTWTCHACRHTETEQRPDQLAGVPVSGLTGG
jgi:hypothetical protein